MKINFETFNKTTTFIKEKSANVFQDAKKAVKKVNFNELKADVLYIYNETKPEIKNSYDFYKNVFLDLIKPFTKK